MADDEIIGNVRRMKRKGLFEMVWGQRKLEYKIPGVIAPGIKSHIPGVDIVDDVSHQKGGGYRSLLLTVDGVLRGVTIEQEFIPCKNGKGLNPGDGRPSGPYCNFWKNVELNGWDNVYHTDETGKRNEYLYRSQPFDAEEERQAFIEIAIELIGAYEAERFPVAKIQFHPKEKITPDIVEFIR